MDYKKSRVIRALCLIVMLICLIRIGQAYVLSAKHEAKRQELKSVLEDADEKPAKKDTGTEGGGQSAEEKPPVGNGADRQADSEEDMMYGRGIPGEEGGHTILEKYKSLYMENGDVAGWLTVEGTKIDYPVMQCGDDEYYLHHDFYGNDSKYGCLYVRGKADLADGTNVIIYGHNMKDGSMFGDLDLYQSADFCREHSTISFDTLYEQRTYEVIAVFRSQVYDVDEDVFKYYQFYEAHTQEEFDDFYQNIKELSLYDTGVMAQLGDTFLTLSTCAYHVTDGRFVVVAKRVRT